MMKFQILRKNEIHLPLLAKTIDSLASRYRQYESLAPLEVQKHDATARQLAQVSVWYPYQQARALSTLTDPSLRAIGRS